MPEMPEVETIKRDLEEKIKGKKISRVRIKDPKAVRGDTSFSRKVRDRTIQGVDRRGKLLFLQLDDDNFIVFHLKMTGQLIYCYNEHMIAGGHDLNKQDPMENAGGVPPHKHTRVIFYLQPEGVLFFNDMRRFGYVKLLSSRQKRDISEELGPEPLFREFTPEIFQKKLQSRKIAVKKVLLDQGVVAGVGNIYADEALFAAGIRPDRPANELNPEEVKELYNSIREVLRKGVKYRGTTFDNYVDGRGGQGNFSRMLRVYGREGEKCGECGGYIEKIRTADRGTHYCPRCQK